MKMMLSRIIGETTIVASSWTPAETLAIVTASARTTATTKTSSNPIAVFIFVLSDLIAVDNPQFFK
jgi:hypothetical protein